MTVFEIHIMTSLVFITAGIFTILTKRSTIRFLMGIMLIMNGSILLFTVFSRLLHGDMRGSVLALFIVLIVAAQVLTGLTLIVHNHFRLVQPDMDNKKNEER